MPFFYKFYRQVSILKLIFIYNYNVLSDVINYKIVIYNDCNFILALSIDILFGWS